MCEIKEIIKSNIQRSLPEDTRKVGLMLSGGMDSWLIGICLHELKYDVTAYTFTRADHESKDFQRAREFAQKFSFAFHPIYLYFIYPEFLRVDIKFLKQVYNAQTKTEIECSWPFFKTAFHVEEKHVFTGYGADGYFCISKKGMMHYKDKINEYRTEHYARAGRLKDTLYGKIFEDQGVKLHFPYFDHRLVVYMSNKTWDECNRPKQKQLLRNQFEPYNVKLADHCNLQLGDSGIAEGFKILLEGTKFKSPTAIYNRI